MKITRTVRLPGLQTTTKITVIGPEGIEHLDWREVCRLEALAARKAAATPACATCGQAMLCGQRQAHFSCMD